jgi:hypothetical protein
MHQHLLITISRQISQPPLDSARITQLGGLSRDLPPPSTCPHESLNSSSDYSAAR